MEAGKDLSEMRQRECQYLRYLVLSYWHTGNMNEDSILFTHLTPMTECIIKVLFEVVTIVDYL